MYIVDFKPKRHIIGGADKMSSSIGTAVAFYFQKGVTGF
jgi:hypothetical protein